MKVVVLLWGPFGHRADELAQVVGAARYNLTFLYGPRYFAPIRYVALALQTLVLLLQGRPDVVYAQNPPIFCPLTALLYCSATRKRLVVDHHSIWGVKTLGGAVGRAIGFFEKVVARGAFASTVPHPVWGAQLRKMGAKTVLVVYDYVTKNPYQRDDQVRRKYAGDGALAIASHGGHPLERLESEVLAAGSVAGLTLVITGPEAKLRSRISSLPTKRNVVYLGMLPMEDYLRLKASCDFALNITDEPYTLSHVIFEYVASSLPVISSRQAVVEEVFGSSLLYVDDSSPNAVASKVSEMLETPSFLKAQREKVCAKFVELQVARRDEVSRLRSLILGVQA
jgi:glycosyltransferase involved in cell wall biosynthesis